MAAKKSAKKTKKPSYNKKLLRKEDIKFFEKMINTPSPTGFEWTGQKEWIKYMKQYTDEVFVDTYGSAVATINPKAKYKVVIEAHCDEISWFVNYITADGLIYVIRNGWSDHQIAPAKRVVLHGTKGKVDGLFGWPAIHTRGRDEQAPSIKNIFIDVGAKTKDEVEKMGIVVGTVITYPDKFMTLNNRYWVGRAMDNRAGGFMIAQVARLLKKNKDKLPFCLHIVNSVQEEIGLRGAEMMAHRLNPDVAIVTDVCHDTSTPMIDQKREGDTQCGKGPVLTVGPAVHNKLRDHIEKVAKKKKLPFQRMAASTYTGTDTDAFAYTQNWVASALISLPLRYMHTTVEMVQKDDVVNTIELMYNAVKAIDPKKPFKYL